MKRKLTALLFVGIPFLLGITLMALIIISFHIKDSLYSLLLFASVIGSLLLPIPGSISSLFGIIKAIKLKKQGENNLWFLFFLKL